MARWLSAEDVKPWVFVPYEYDPEVVGASIVGESKKLWVCVVRLEDNAELLPKKKTSSKGCVLCILPRHQLSPFCHLRWQWKKPVLSLPLLGTSHLWQTTRVKPPQRRKRFFTVIVFQWTNRNRMFSGCCVIFIWVRTPVNY